MSNRGRSAYLCLFVHNRATCENQQYFVFCIIDCITLFCESMHFINKFFQCDTKVILLLFILYFYLLCAEYIVSFILTFGGAVLYSYATLRKARFICLFAYSVDSRALMFIFTLHFSIGGILLSFCVNHRSSLKASLRERSPQFSCRHLGQDAQSRFSSARA